MGFLGGEGRGGGRAVNSGKNIVVVLLFWSTAVCSVTMLVFSLSSLSPSLSQGPAFIKPTQRLIFHLSGREKKKQTEG